MTKHKTNTERVWLDPSKNTTGVVVPQWEGTSNPPPQYMDLVLYNMHRLYKTKLIQYMNVHKQMSMEELLSTFFHYSAESHILCLPFLQDEEVIYASKNSLGQVIALSKEGGEYIEQINAVSNKKWDYAIIEYESPDDPNSSYQKNIYGSMRPGKKMLTMHDKNFTLAKACRIVEPIELYEHLIEWGNNLNQNGVRENIASFAG